MGKTELIESCEGLPLEVITADAMQAYCLMNIGTAKPSEELRRKIPHHLLDIRYPNEQFTVGDFVTLSNQLAGEISSRGKLPVLVGGSGFYVWNFLHGLPKTPRVRDEIRVRVKEMMESRPWEQIWQKLQTIDPVSARRISPRDGYRIARAMEIYLESGMPLSSFPIPDTPRNDVVVIGLHREKEQLRARITQRCEKMFREGLPEEVDLLMSRGYRSTDPGIRAIGYREFWQEYGEYHAEHGRLPENLSVVRTQIAANSRAYVKRQYTYFSKLSMVKWYDAEKTERIQEALQEHVDI